MRVIESKADNRQEVDLGANLVTSATETISENIEEHCQNFYAYGFALISVTFCSDVLFLHDLPLLMFLVYQP